ncbi:MAG: DUF547 domain-containing protein [Bacteroidota bacterium]
MKNQILFIIFFLGLFFTSFAETLQPSKVSHTAWNELVSKYVTASGKVNYKGFIQEKAKFQGYLDALAAEIPASSWSRNEKLAYWINAYNAYTVKLIIDNYPLKSITNLNKPWDTKFFKLAGKSYSLNEIEHQIIRPVFKDPRIHFAVNCASASCPKLLNEAYTASKLDSQLTAQTRSYVNNGAHNSLNGGSAQISSIFDWYKDDFSSKGGVVAFINTYTSKKLSTSAKLSYKEYDWTLNE